MAAPPVFVGAVQLSDIELPLGVPVRAVGAPGTVASTAFPSEIV